jgi:helicase
MDELSETKICERYSVGPGDVFGMVESVNWLVHATTELSRMFKLTFYQKIKELEVCMKNGIRRELLPLVRLRGIGRVRARRLFNNGITSVELLQAAGIDTISKIIGQGIAEQLFAQLRKQNDLRDDSPRKDTGERGESGQSVLSRFGSVSDE